MKIYLLHFASHTDTSVHVTQSAIIAPGTALITDHEAGLNQISIILYT